MGFEFVKKLPRPEEIREQYPVSSKLAALKEKKDDEIKQVITGKSDTFRTMLCRQ